ncbi:MAG: ABC transporter permease subunit [Solirubrobacterales bacterium]|nr:ABC transporter permease subunit [Solirubrobacterales bacterium]
MGRLSAAAAVVVLLGAWELYARAGGIDELVLPAPSAIGETLWTDRGLLAENFVVTATEIAGGIALALVLGCALAVALHVSRPLRGTLYPLLVASQAIPIVILAPLLVIWLGFGVLPKLAIIGLVCLLKLIITTLDGLRAVDPDQRKLLRSMDASRTALLRFVELPAAAPAALSGARIAVAVAVVGAVFAEYAGSSKGLGHLMLQAVPQLETPRAWAAVVVLAAFSVTLFTALGALERRLTHNAGGSP